MRRTVFFGLALITKFYYVVAFFQYGTHKTGEVESFRLKSAIKAFEPIYRVNITHSRDDVEEQYTYLSVQTMTEAAKHPIIIFDPENKMLSFFIRYPLYTVFFTVIGYSMALRDNLNTTETLDTTTLTITTL